MDLYTERTIRTYSGIYVDVFDPKPEMFVIEDIAHALSHVPRWGGHFPEFYSVATHSILVATMTKGNPMEALLHDASEAYLMDIMKPIKRHLKEYEALEDGVMRCIAERWGFEYPLSEATKEADKFMLETEWLAATGNDERVLQVMCNAGGMWPHRVKHSFLTVYGLICEHGKQWMKTADRSFAGGDWFLDLVNKK